MSFITSFLNDVTHFGKAIEQFEMALKQAEPGSEAELKLLLECSFCYGYIQLQKGDLFADKAMALAEKRGDDKRLGQALCCKAFNQFRIGYSNQAQVFTMRALSLFESIDDIGGAGDAHWLMGTMMEVIGTGNESFHHKKALEAYQQLGDETGIYLARIQQSSLPLLQLRMAEVIANQELLLKELTQIGKYQLTCLSYYEISRALFMQRELPALKKNMELWRDRAKEIGDFHYYTQAKALLTECYRLQNLDEAVMQECLESIECCEKLGTIHGESTMLIILANICYQQSYYEDAVKYYEQADEVALKIDSFYKHNYALNGAGLALLKLGDLEGALKKFETALADSKKNHDPLNLIEAHRNIAELAFAQGDFNNAILRFKELFDIAGAEGIRMQDYGKYATVIAKASEASLYDAGFNPKKRSSLQLKNLKRHLELAQEQQVKAEEATALGALADYYEQTTDFKRALEHHKKYSQVYEELVKDQNNSAIGKLRLQYETDVKDREIALLKKENDQVLLKERLRISRDLHDDMGTTLGSIGMYSEIAINNLKEKYPGQLKELLEKIGRASRLTIDRLGDLVWSIDPVHDSFENMLDRMKAFAAMMLNPHEIGFAIESTGDFTGMILTIQQRKNVFLIFKEVIYNIIKYAECSMVNVTLTYSPACLQLVIEDDGKGFNISKVNSYNGNGLKNMKARALEMNGEFTIQAEAGKGSRVFLKVKV